MVLCILNLVNRPSNIEYDGAMRSCSVRSWSLMVDLSQCIDDNMTLGWWCYYKLFKPKHLGEVDDFFVHTFCAGHLSSVIRNMASLEELAKTYEHSFSHIEPQRLMSFYGKLLMATFVWLAESYCWKFDGILPFLIIFNIISVFPQPIFKLFVPNFWLDLE